MEPAARRVAFHTFGCKLNQFETEAAASSFRAHGFVVVGAGEPADVHMVNTCTVTARADHKARSLIRGLARENPRAPLLVTGCSAQTEAAALSALAANVVVIPQSEKSRLLTLPETLAEVLAAGEDPAARLRDLLKTGLPGDPFAVAVTDFSFHTRAFLKIQDGCDCSCAYCRVPLARGTSVSLGLDEVLRRGAELEASGRREIVLTGVNISAWRHSEVTLTGLIRRLLRATTHARFRLTSLEPESITEELAEALSDARVCPHFHIPVQSGSDPVLARMRRRYHAEKVSDGVRLLREARDDPFIAADILVGFPGESEDDFSRTRELIEACDLAALHVFPFSPRPGTSAATMKPAVPERSRRERARILAALARELSLSYTRRWVGREVDVLLEGKSGSHPHGISDNYLKVAVTAAPVEAVPGRMVRAAITVGTQACVGRFLGFVG
jgi:threonylcarbamoyladenosine tRNA methylthiotransferase MtaB